MYEQDYNDRQIEKLIKEYRTKVTILTKHI
jgi:hypothetical protein